MEAHVISLEALDDVQSIWDFIASDSVRAADRMLDELFNAFEQLAKWPGQGHSRSDLTKRNVRFWPVASYLVVYRENSDRLQIVAVLHGARDVCDVMRSR